jgi:hypothetical protein
MNTSTVSTSTAPSYVPPAHRPSAGHRFLGVVARPQSYRNIAYLLLGLPLGTIWFSVLVSVTSVSVSMLVVALIGIPLLVGTWYVVRAFANVERAAANVLLDQHVAPAPMAAGVSGNLWVRLRRMSSDRGRWRELGFLMLRFPAGIATFTLAVTALTVPVTVAYTPIHARLVDEPFGDWFWSSGLEDFAGHNPWSWTLVPAGAVLLFGAFHLMNAVARMCGRWTASWLTVAATSDRPHAG